MGRRATGSTKSGRFMNPTDQARKYLKLSQTRETYNYGSW